VNLNKLNPKFLDGYKSGTGIGMLFDCPCGKCEHHVCIMFRNPIEGPAYTERPSWQRTGESFETMTLSPSVHKDPALGGCGWHGWVRNGEVVAC
jgi:hypothetical protein